MFGTGNSSQTTLDEVFEYFMSVEDTCGAEVLNKRRYAIEFAESFGVSRKKLDEVADKFLAKIDNSSLLLFFPENLKIVVSIVRLGASKKITEKAISVCAEKGFRRDVIELAKLLDRDPTEEEAYKVVEADIKSASRTGGHGKHRHSFMTDAEVDLLKWAEQYVGSEKIRELKAGYSNKNFEWKNDLL